MRTALTKKSSQIRCVHSHSTMGFLGNSHDYRCRTLTPYTLVRTRIRECLSTLVSNNPFCLKVRRTRNTMVMQSPRSSQASMYYARKQQQPTLLSCVISSRLPESVTYSSWKLCGRDSSP